MKQTPEDSLYLVPDRPTAFHRSLDDCDVTDVAQLAELLFKVTPSSGFPPPGVTAWKEINSNFLDPPNPCRWNAGEKGR